MPGAHEPCTGCFDHSSLSHQHKVYVDMNNHHVVTSWLCLIATLRKNQEM